MTLEELFAGRPIDIPAVLKRLKTTAEQLGLPFGDRGKTYNSRLAQELGLWAESLGKGDEFHHAAFRAYFVDGENIAKIPVLLEMAESAGLSAEEARKALETRAFREAVDADWSLSRKRGVSAVPSFLFKGERLAGAQPYEKLAQLMDRHQVRKIG